MRPETAPASSRYSQEKDLSFDEEKLQIAENDHTAVSTLLSHKIDQNEFIIDKLTQENAEISQLLAQSEHYAVKIIKENGEEKVEKQPTDTVLNAAVKDAKLTLDRELAQKRKLEREFQVEQDDIELLQEEIDRPEPIVERAIKRLRTLENELDDAAIKEKEAFSIQDTYNIIISKLKKQTLSFENELKKADFELLQKEQDIQELAKYVADAEEAAELVKAEHENFSQQIKETNQARKEELKSRREEAEEIILKEQADNAKNIPVNYEKEVAFGQENGEKEDVALQLTFYAQQLKKLREIAGIDDLEELIKKAQNQTLNYETLEKTVEESEEKLSDVQKQVLNYKISLQDAEFAENSISKRAVDRLKMDIQEARFSGNNKQMMFLKAENSFNLIMKGVIHIAELLYIIEGGENIDLQNVELPQVLDLIKSKLDTLQKELIEQSITTSAQMHVSLATKCVEIEEEEELELSGFDGVKIVQEEEEVNEKQIFEQKTDLDFERIRKMQKEVSRKIVEDEKKDEW